MLGQRQLLSCPALHGFPRETKDSKGSLQLVLSEPKTIENNDGQTHKSYIVRATSCCLFLDHSTLLGLGSSGVGDFNCFILLVLGLSSGLAPLTSFAAAFPTAASTSLFFLKVAFLEAMSQQCLPHLGAVSQRSQKEQEAATEQQKSPVLVPRAHSVTTTGTFPQTQREQNGTFSSPQNHIPRDDVGGIE